MDPALLTGLPASISAARFATYLAAAGSDPAKGVRLYTWNVELAGSFWGPMQAVEVCLRNAVQSEMAVLFGRADWWHDPATDLHFRHREQVDAAVATVTRRLHSPTPGDVVAELSFGFWTGLLGSTNRYEQRFWTPGVRRAFPRYHGRRNDLLGRVDRVRLLRNRIAHHEPIFDRNSRLDYDTILTVAGWLNHDTQRWIATQSRVNAVLAKRHTVVNHGTDSSF